MNVARVSFTLLLVGFLVADSVVNGLLFGKLETDGKFKKNLTLY